MREKGYRLSQSSYICGTVGVGRAGIDKTGSSLDPSCQQHGYVTVSALWMTCLIASFSDVKR